MRQRPSRSPCASQARCRAAARSRGRSRSPRQAASRRERRRETSIRAARPSRRGMPLRSPPLLCDRASAESHRGRALEAAPPLRERRQSCWRLVRGSKRYALTRTSRRPPALDCKRFASQRATPLRAEPEGDVTTRETHATDVAACAACVGIGLLAAMPQSAAAPPASPKPSASPSKKKDVCGATKSKWAHLQCEEYNDSAPGDEYFGRMKISYLGIDNTYKDGAISAGAYTTDPQAYRETRLCHGSAA